MANDKEKESGKIDPATGQKDDSPPQNKHGVLTTQTTPKEPDETRVSATDEGHKDKKR